MKKKVLITGGCGKIGVYFAKYAAYLYAIHIADKIPWNTKKHGRFPGETVVADLQDFTQCQKICSGMDTVIHLAADGDPQADFSRSLLGNNIIATHNMFRAAKAAGCKRFIYASSAHVVSGYKADLQINANMPVCPGNEYGVSKAFGEALAAYFAKVQGLPTIVLRIGAYTLPEEYAGFNRMEMDAFLDADDFNHLLINCLETQNIDFFIAHAISDNRYKRLDITETIEKLGYQPKADSFLIFN